MPKTNTDSLKVSGAQSPMHQGHSQAVTPNMMSIFLTINYKIIGTLNFGEIIFGR